MNHAHGYHGLDKGVCLYCGSAEPEDQFCEKRTAYEARRARNHHDQLALARKALARLSLEERKALAHCAMTVRSFHDIEPALFREATQPQPIVPCRRDPETCSCDQHVGKPGNVWDGK
jgi:predicted alpha/beta superfamily hydrolase